MREIISFLKESRNEFGHVVWPTKNATLRLTLVVIVISVIIGAFVGGLDFIFTSIMDWLLGR